MAILRGVWEQNSVQKRDHSLYTGRGGMQIRKFKYRLELTCSLNELVFGETIRAPRSFPKKTQEASPPPPPFPPPSLPPLCIRRVSIGNIRFFNGEPVIFKVWAAWWSFKNIQQGRGRSPRFFWMLFKLPAAAPTPLNSRIFHIPTRSIPIEV